MENRKNFVKVGENVMFKQITEGLDYELENGVVYEPKYDRYSGDITLKKTSELSLPKKIYSTANDDKFIEKVLNQYETVQVGVLGVMLAGLKGSGKSVMAKNIAVQSGLPIVVMDKTFPAYQLKTFFTKMKNVSACILFDEIDKIGEDYDDDLLLQVLDGMNTAGKKLVVFTCNDTEEVNEYLIDRCSRIRYWKEFDEMSASMINQVLTDNLDDKSKVDELTDFIQENLKCISFDNILSFVKEVNCYPEETFDDLLDDMNLSRK